MTTDDEKSVQPQPKVDLGKRAEKDSGDGPAPSTPTEITESSGVEVTDGADTVLDAADADTVLEAADADTVLEAADADQTDIDTSEAAADTPAVAARPPRRRASFGQSRRLAYIVLPVLALLLAATTGFLVWKDISASAAERARAESVQAAKDSTVRLLSYKPDTVEAELTSARDLLTGNFKDSYTQLTNDVVIPGAKEKHISAVANVPAVASVEASKKHAVALVFVNQIVTVGDGAPTATASTVQITLDKVDGRWLISEFDPV